MKTFLSVLCLALMVALSGCSNTSKQSATASPGAMSSGGAGTASCCGTCGGTCSAAAPGAVKECGPDCTKPCCAAKQGKSCGPDCKKPCCAVEADANLGAVGDGAACPAASGCTGVCPATGANLGLVGEEKPASCGSK